jgi:hypothetical protein
MRVSALASEFRSGHSARVGAKTISLVAGLCLFASCDNLASSYRRLGVSLRGQSVVVTYLACKGESIEWARMLRLDGDNVAGESGDVEVWRQSPSAAEAVAGVIPADSSGPIVLTPGERYFVELETTRNGADSDGFRLSDLRSDLVRVKGTLKTKDAYVRDARASCADK